MTVNVGTHTYRRLANLANVMGVTVAQLLDDPLCEWLETFEASLVVAAEMTERRSVRGRDNLVVIGSRV